MATNTEKPSTKAEQKKNIVHTPKQTKQKPIQKPIKKEEVKEEKINKEEVKEKDEKVEDQVKKEKVEEKPKEKKDTTPKIKKDYAIVNGKSLPISAKDAKFICKFIKNKKIPKAIEDLEQVLVFKKPIPMKGEIPHRKGKIMSGRFPVKAVRVFISLLKSLQGNVNMHEIEEAFIKEAMANIAQRPFGRFGIKRKRTHVSIKAIERKKKEKKPKQQDKKQEEKK